MNQKYINELSYNIIGCAMEVHKVLGPGLLESIYEVCFIEELRNAGLSVKSQISIPIFYKNKNMGVSMKIDLLINDLIIVENKAVECIIPVHKAQLLTYLKLSNLPKGLLINFNTVTIKEQVVSMVTKIYSELPEY